MKWWHAFGMMVCVLLLGCAGAETAVTPTAAPTPSPTANEPELVTTAVLPVGPDTVTLLEGNTAVRDFTICLAGEPTSLFFLEDDSLVAQHVRHALYEPLLTHLQYDYQPRGLVKLPSLEDGDAVVETVNVGQGELVINSSGQLVLLEPGVEVFGPNRQRFVFDGQPLPMSRLRVSFTFAPLVWSDGTAVTADDSLFAFELAAAPSAPGDKLLVSRTASYEVLDERTVRWTGIPGWLDTRFFLNVWPPLPRHAYTAEDGRIDFEQIATNPLSSGPFIVGEWVRGSHLTLLPNRDYYRAADGFPKLERLRLRFFAPTTDLVAAMLSGECHILLDETLDPLHLPFYLEAAANDLLTPHFAVGDHFESLIFGINPVASYEVERAYDWFDDPRVRQGLAMCLDREAIAAAVLQGKGEALVSYVSQGHPLFAPLLNQWTYDPVRGQALLETAGFVDGTGDGIVEGPNGDSFRLSLLMLPEPEWAYTAIGDKIVTDFAACGVSVRLSYLSAAALLAEEADAPLFGRQFDLSVLSLPLTSAPPCGWYMTEAIPGEPTDGDGVDWSGVNVGGWSNGRFDEACAAAQVSFWGTADFEQNHQAALTIFANELPVIPLYPQLRVALTHPRVSGFMLDSTQPSPLWNVYEIGWAE